MSRRNPVEWGGGMAFAVRKGSGRDLGPLGYEPFQECIKGVTGKKSVPGREREREKESERAGANEETEVKRVGSRGKYPLHNPCRHRRRCRR